MDNQQINTNDIPILHKYDVGNKVWTMRNELKEHQLWTSQWWCDDGDGVELYIENDKGGFELNCFSGIPSSSIYVDIVDFGTLWSNVIKNSNNKLEPIKNYTHIQQCVIIADWLCSLFCEYTDVSNYKQS